MAGAMRRMGIYLGLVEDDDARAYGRYDARQSDQPDHDRRYGRYEDSRYEADYADEPYPEERYGRDDDRAGRADERYGAGYADDREADEAPPAREPEPVTLRRPAASARPLGLASSTPPAGATRMGGSLGGGTSGSGAGGPGGGGAGRRRARGHAGGQGAVPDHHGAPEDLQRGPPDRRALPRGRCGDHEPHRAGRRRREATGRLRRGTHLRPSR